MTIDAIEDHTKVMTPTGHEGRIQVTRRERKLISDGLNLEVSVLGLDGLLRRYPINQLTEIVPEEEQVINKEIWTIVAVDDDGTWPWPCVHESEALAIAEIEKYLKIQAEAEGFELSDDPLILVEKTDMAYMKALRITYLFGKDTYFVTRHDNHRS